MRIGIVSDIHGHGAALATALERMGDVDELLCAGDIVAEHRFDNHAVGLLRDRGARCVQGNHDIGILSPRGERARGAAHVETDLVEYLAAQPRSIDVRMGTKRLVMTHASPCPPYTQYVMPHSPELRRLADVDADYIVIGHTHAQFVARAGKALVINPGSAGLATDPRNGKRLSYAVLDTTTDEVTFDDFETPDQRERDQS